MNLKYYLRGLGIGIVVTALLMSLSARNQDNLTDEEIKARAVELGMVEQKVLSDISTPEPEVSEVAKPTKEPTVTVEPEAEPTKEPITEPTANPTETPTAEPPVTVTEAPEEPLDQSAVITLTIVSGETSWSISEALYEAGVVESASDFDTYLCQNGYDKTIRTGTFEISKNATYEEIAKKIAR